MKAAQVLDMQADLLRRFDNPAFQAVITQTLTPYYENDISANRDHIAQAIHGTVKMADAYRVTDAMSLLVQYMATKLEPEDKWDSTLTPTPWGIVRFDRPLPIDDVRGRRMLAHWMTWGPSTTEVRHTALGGLTEEKPGTFLTFWNDAADPDEIQREIELRPAYREYVRRVIGRWAFVGAEIVPNHTSLGPQEVARDEDFERVASEGVEPHPWTNSRRYAHALFLLLNDTITNTSEERIPRAAQRRIGALPIPGRISVVALRREAHSAAHGESLAWLIHRFVVRGHPAWRQCSPDKPGAQPYEKGWRVRVWIKPYWKGPEDGPVLQTTKVYELKR